MARTFLITTLSIFLCLVLPAQADTVPVQLLLIGENGSNHNSLGQVTSAPEASSQAVSKKTGLSAYRRNLERLRSNQASNTSPKNEPSRNESSQNEPPSATKIQPAQAPSIQAPPLSQKTSRKKQRPFFRNRSNQQRVSPTEKEQLGQKQQTIQDANKEKSLQAKPKKSFLNQEVKNNTVQNRNNLEGSETNGNTMRAYDMIQAARQPYGGQNKTFLARPNLPKPTLPKRPALPNMTPQNVSERVSELHTRLRKQPARLNKAVVEPLQGKVTELKEQVGTTAKTTLQQQLNDRGISDKFADSKAALQQQLDDRGIPDKFTNKFSEGKTALQQQLDNRGIPGNLSDKLSGGIADGQIGNRIQTTKTSLKTVVINFLKHIEHKAHKAAEQLNQG